MAFRCDINKSLTDKEVVKMTQDNSNGTNTTLEDKGKASPPYIPFLTFSNMIMWLETEGVPVKFDRSFWGKKYSGSLGSQLMTGLRFLGLLKGEHTQPLLGDIVKATGDDRKKLLVNMIQQSYSAVDFSQLSGGTPNMLKEWFATYHLDGNTERKARSFFINACKSYGVSISNTLRKSARAKQFGGGTREKKAVKTGEQVEKGANAENKDSSSSNNKPKLPPPPGFELQDLYKIVLSDGCELRLCSNRMFFDLEKMDRELIDSLVELMKKRK